ncbi:hypothetical protein [Aureimonas flava]|uniref:hypothetical protein n=1 Tax=Aureimonas flava TaxID=2320271 RepID=UPI0010A96F19|nr:hypothetical protein [Aureimonas flava]
MGKSFCRSAEAQQVRRTVDISFVEDAAVTDALDGALFEWQEPGVRAWEAITWAILDNPEVGMPVTESGNLRLVEYPGSVDDNEPTVFLLYERTAINRITLVDVKFTQSKYQQAGKA